MADIGMTFHFGHSSRQRLSTCHPDLIAVCEEAIKHVDFMVVCGHRNQADQTTAHTRGYSKLEWPHSRHNSVPSEAVDLAPWEGNAIPWKDKQAFRALSVHIMQAAKKLGVELEWGGSWRTFQDLPHYQLRKRE